MRKHNYVVGFSGENQCIYGKDKNNQADYISPMTILQAIRELKSLAGDNKAIYKLVKIVPTKEKFKHKIINQMVKD